jgi:trehalose 6-phosphate synthase
VYPISVDAQAVSTAAAAPEVQRRATELRREWGSPHTVFLGVDRIDYTKGIPERLEAYEKLLSDGLVSAEDAVFVQVGSPSRENVDAYQALSESIDSLVSRINHAYPGTARAAIVYVAENLSREEMLALFVAADVMVVTSLADGMNLVAKEFVACRQDDSGVLVLSKNTGAADHMAQALLVDPYDIDDIAGAMGRAMVMPPSEVAHRMGILRADVTEHDVDSWATTILADLALIQAHSPR